MMADTPYLLTTGQAAKLCSVTPDTILKWIKKGRLGGVRTVGGHYRIERGDLLSLIGSGRSTKERRRQRPQCDRESLRCWEYRGRRGVVGQGCRQCVVYRLRAARCFLMAGLESDVGHARRFCGSTCDECDFYRRVKGLATNVLVITSDDDLVARLSAEEDEGVTLRFARNGYEASAIIHDFRPAFAVVDIEGIASGGNELLDCLGADARVPGLKIALVVPPGLNIGPGIRAKHESIVSVLEKPLGSRRITAMIDSCVTELLAPEDISPDAARL